MNITYVVRKIVKKPSKMTDMNGCDRVQDNNKYNIHVSIGLQSP